MIDQLHFVLVIESYVELVCSHVSPFLLTDVYICDHVLLLCVIIIAFDYT
jgi:hypothetical protein